MFPIYKRDPRLDMLVADIVGKQYFHWRAVGDPEIPEINMKYTYLNITIGLIFFSCTRAPLMTGRSPLRNGSGQPFTDGRSCGEGRRLSRNPSRPDAQVDRPHDLSRFTKAAAHSEKRIHTYRYAGPVANQCVLRHFTVLRSPR